MKILVYNLLGRKSFDLINILRRNFNEDNLIYGCDVCNRKLKFIYGDVNFHLLRDGFFNEDLRNISEYYKSESIVYIPIEEGFTIRFYEFIKKYGKRNFEYMLPSFQSYNLSRKKHDLNIFCEENLIPAPKYYSEQNIVNDDFDFPVILKPKTGSGSNGIKFIKSRDELLIQNVDFENYFFQELLENSKDIKAGFFLCDEGQIISFYSHSRIRTFPERGGVSVFSKSELNEGIKNASVQIIKDLKWSGLIMIEYLFDSKFNEYKLIEINPRLWGSILLSEFNNAKFISIYISMCLGLKYRVEIVEVNKSIRWIFPYDIFYFFKHPTNPINFFSKDINTCYINFTYSTLSSSLVFIICTYFNIARLKNKLFHG